MSVENSHIASLRQKAIYEFLELLGIFVYLGFFFCSIATYKILLLNDFQAAYFTYGSALINAFVVAKVILIGECTHLGKKHEAKPLLESAILKAFLFGLLVFGFQAVEEAIKLLLHGESIAIAIHKIRMDDVMARSVVVFSSFIPLFAFRELRRVLGRDKFRDLFLHSGHN